MKLITLMVMVAMQLGGIENGDDHVVGVVCVGAGVTVVAVNGW